ncbi:MAG: hypothetical protein ABSG96_02100 [Terracidiphilus sp.]
MREQLLSALAVSLMLILLGVGVSAPTLAQTGAEAAVQGEEVSTVPVVPQRPSGQATRMLD